MTTVKPSLAAPRKRPSAFPKLFPLTMVNYHAWHRCRLGLVPWPRDGANRPRRHRPQFDVTAPMWGV